MQIDFPSKQTGGEKTNFERELTVINTQECKHTHIHLINFPADFSWPHKHYTHRVTLPSTGAIKINYIVNINTLA